MSLSEMARLAKNSGLAKNDAQWWPKWMEAYARSVHQVDAPRIDISRESLISLLQRMRDSGKSVWVRLQVVRAVEFYQKSVLQSSVPDLSDVWLGGLTGGLGRAKPSDRLPNKTNVPSLFPRSSDKIPEIHVSRQFTLSTSSFRCSNDSGRSDAASAWMFEPIEFR